MFGSNGLSMPEAFAREHHSLRLTSESSRPQPTGSCHFLLVNPSAKSRICACQIYHHNRSAPGDVCDCGHSACYHTPTFGDKAADNLRNPRSDLADKVKRLEDSILAERDARDVLIARERSAWEREIRVLREALAPFYQTEQLMQKKLLELEGRVDSTVNLHHHLHERMASLSDANMVLHKQVTSSLSTFTGVHHRHTSPTPNDDVPGLTSSDDRSSVSSFSRHQTPYEASATAATSVTGADPESPRSSGILNLASVPRPPVTIPAYQSPRRVSAQREEREEPRSSGFLGVNLKEQIKINMARKKVSGQQGRASPSTQSQASSHRQHPYDRGYHQRKSPATSATVSTPLTVSGRHSTPRSLPRPSPPANGYMSADHIMYNENRSHQNGKMMPSPRGIGPDIMALDVLADVSAASPVIRSR